MNGRPGVSERTRSIVLHAVDQLGAARLVLLLDQLGEATPVNGEYLFRPELVVRASTAPRR